MYKDTFQKTKTEHLFLLLLFSLRWKLHNDIDTDPKKWVMEKIMQHTEYYHWHLIGRWHCQCLFLFPSQNVDCFLFFFSLSLLPIEEYALCCWFMVHSLNDRHLRLNHFDVCRLNALHYWFIVNFHVVCDFFSLALALFYFLHWKPVINESDLCDTLLHLKWSTFVRDMRARIRATSLNAVAFV